MRIRVIKALGDDTAIVSTRGYRRIVDEKGRTLQEFVSSQNIRRVLEVYNACFAGTEYKAKAITYGEACRISRQSDTNIA